MGVGSKNLGRLVKRYIFFEKKAKSSCKFKNNLVSLCRFCEYVTKCYETQQPMCARVMPKINIVSVRTKASERAYESVQTSMHAIERTYSSYINK